MTRGVGITCLVFKEALLCYMVALPRELLCKPLIERMNVSGISEMFKNEFNAMVRYAHFNQVI